MKKSALKVVSVMAILSLTFVGGCGLATSNEDRVERAKTQIEEGDYRTAMIELKNVLASDPNDATARLLLAKVSLGLGDILTAEKELEKAAELDAPESDVMPLHLQTLLARGSYTEVLAALGMDAGGLTPEQERRFRGKALLSSGNAESAEAAYAEWLEADPTSVEAAVGLADARLMSGDVEFAISSLQEQVEAAPNDSAAWQSLGNALFRSGDYAGAESAMINAADNLKPQTHIFRYGLILAGLTEVELILDKRDDARRNLERLMGIAPNSPIALMLAARLARADGDNALAVRHLQALLNVSPDNTQAQLFLAQAQMAEGNYSQAENLLQRVVAAMPGNLLARQLLAKSQLQQAQPGGAIEVLAPLLESDSQNVDTYTLMAQASMQQGNTEEAIRQLRKSVEIAPDDMNAKLNLASALLDTKATDEALAVLAEVPEGTGAPYRRVRLMMAALTAKGDLEGADAIADTLLSGSETEKEAAAIVVDHYLRSQRIDEAREILKNLIAARPQEPGAKNVLARLEMSDGNSAVAQELFSSVLASDEDNLVASMGIASLLYKAGDTDTMIEVLEKAANAHRDALDPRAALARYHLSEGNLQEAERAANELVTIGGQNVYVSTVISDVFVSAGRYEEGLYHAKQAALLAPNIAGPQMGVAKAYLAMDRTDDARAAVDRALEILPGLPAALRVMTLLELREGRLDEAQELTAKLRSLHPDDVTGMVLEGEVLSQREKYLLAAEAFRRAVYAGAGRNAMLREYQELVKGKLPQPEATLTLWLKENSDDAVARSYLAQHYQLNNSRDQAIQEYETVLKQNPENAAVLNNLAWEYQQKGDLGRAAELAEKAYTLAATSGSIADTLGWIYYDQGRLDESLELLSEATELAPDNAEIQYHYAAALAKSGDKGTARRLLEELMKGGKVFPSRESADELLDTL